jgi:hypothetical protein
MKISKKRLMEILQEECGMAMNTQPGMVNGEIDEEGKMAKRQLADIAEYAQELSGMLQDETQLEAWVQSKLTKAADYIKTVKHYVEYGMEEGAYDQVMPQMDHDMTYSAPEMAPMALEMPSEDDQTMDFEYDMADFDDYDEEY